MKGSSYMADVRKDTINFILMQIKRAHDNSVIVDREKLIAELEFSKGLSYSRIDEYLGVLERSGRIIIDKGKIELVTVDETAKPEETRAENGST